MKQKFSTARLTLWISRGIAVILAGLVIFLPRLMEWYSSLRNLARMEHNAIVIAFYCCAVVCAGALWDLDKLLRNIIAGRVFIRENVKRIRRLQWYCALVALICLPVAILYLPISFMVVIMTFLSLVVSVVAQVMGAAVDIREENDLTI